jgi:hypothetical protein
MSNTRRYLTAGGTFACALTTGFLMQTFAEAPVTAQPANETMAPVTVAEAEPAALPDPRSPEATGTPTEIDTSEPLLELSDVMLTSALPDVPAAGPQPMPLPDRRLEGAAFVNASFEQTPVGDLPVEQAAPAFDCELALVAKPVAAAMVDLALDAPCLPNERFTLHHQGMMFTQVTDAGGTWTRTVPALAEEALFIVAFGNGEGAMANAEVTSVPYYDRVVVQWSGHSGLQIHAREYGADYGEDGHVWADAARDMSVAASGEGGFITRLGLEDGAAGRKAEVYTFPSAIAVREGTVSLSVEAEVDQATCGRDIEAQSILIHQGDRPTVHDIVLAMPKCDATGDFLVLKNIVNDLKIARN